MSKYVGQRCGDYRLTAYLGEGGFAEVYLGENIFLGTKAAVKILKHGFTGEKMEEFRYEAQTITGLRHPRIVQLSAFGETIIDGERVPFLVMDYAPHGSLDKRHPPGTKLPFGTILMYLKQLVEALQYAHEQQVVHRDIKPANFLLGADEKVLLSDFGIAVLVHRDESWKEQKRAGSWHYAAPEHFNGKAVPASDQYALAVVVYEWLCGERPFQGNFIQLAYQHRTQPPPPLHEKITIAPMLENTILRALSKDPVQRFPSVQDFIFALEYVSQEEIPVSGQKVPIGTTQCIYGTLASVDALAWSPNGRSIAASNSKYAAQIWDAYSGKMLGIYYDGTGFPEAHRGHSGWKYRYSPDGQYIASVDSKNTLTIQKVTHDTTHTRSYSNEDLAWSPDGRRIAAKDHSYSSYSRDNKWTESILVLDTANGVIICTCRDRLDSSGNKQSLQTVAWSPDGRHIAASYSNSTIRIWDTTKGRKLRFYNGTYVDTIEWSPDGRLIASKDGLNYAILIWDPFEGKVFCTYKGAFAYNATRHWSPDAKYLASLNNEHKIQVWDITNGKTIFTSDDQANVFAWSPDGKLLAISSNNEIVQVWNPYKRVKVWASRKNGHWDQVQTITWSPDGLLLTSGSNSEVRVWGTTNGKTYCIYRPSRAATSIWSPDGTRIASSIDNHNIEIWNPANGAKVSNAQGHTAEAWTLPLLLHSQGRKSSTGQIWSPNGQRIASASPNNQAVDIRDATSGQTSLTYRSHTSHLPATSQFHQLQAVAWSPNGTRVASADLSDRTVHVWNPTNGKPICIYYGYSDQVSELIWSPDSEHVASFGLDKKEIYIWNTTRGETICIYRGYVTQAPPEHSTKQLEEEHNSAGRTRHTRRMPPEHSMEHSKEEPPVQVLHWSPDGQYIASVGYHDKTVHIWNPTDGTTMYIYHEHTSEIKALAWSPDGQRIASAGDEVRIWQAL